MSNFKDLRNKSKSIECTQKITSAMKIVATTKLRKFEEKWEHSAIALHFLMDTISRLMPNVTELGNGTKPDNDAELAFGLSDCGSSDCGPSLLSPISGDTKDISCLLIVITSDKGLCGAFNTNIVRYAKSVIRDRSQKYRDVKILCIGTHGYEALQGDYGEQIIHHFASLNKTNNSSNSFAHTQRIMNVILDMFYTQQIGVCEVVYNMFINIMKQEVTALPLIPIFISQHDQGDLVSMEDSNLFGLLSCDTAIADVLGKILPFFLASKLYYTLLESSTSENSSRMTAMDTATKNADSIIEDLKLKYNKLRREKITQDLIEIVSGAQALS